MPYIYILKPQLYIAVLLNKQRETVRSGETSGMELWSMDTLDPLDPDGPARSGGERVRGLAGEKEVLQNTN